MNRESAVNSIYATFAKDCLNDEQLMLGTEPFERAAAGAFGLLARGKPRVPRVIRLAGQSGTGKTTQLLPAISASVEVDDYVHIAVRTFAPYHPYYEQIKAEFGKDEVRERTNGFALLMLFRVAEMLIENGYGILFEMTLVAPEFEVYLARLAKANGYSVMYNIFAVPKYVSDALIDMRMRKEGRVVYKGTADYFYDVLALSLAQFEQENDLFDSRDLFILWTACAKEPLCVSHCCDKTVLRLFENERNKAGVPCAGENELDELREAKTKFFKRLRLFNPNAEEQAREAAVSSGRHHGVFY